MALKYVVGLDHLIGGWWPTASSLIGLQSVPSLPRPQQPKRGTCGEMRQNEQSTNLPPSLLRASRSTSARAHQRFHDRVLAELMEAIDARSSRFSAINNEITMDDLEREDGLLERKVMEMYCLRLQRATEAWSYASIALVDCLWRESAASTPSCYHRLLSCDLSNSKETPGRLLSSADTDHRHCISHNASSSSSSQDSRQSQAHATIGRCPGRIFISMYAIFGAANEVRIEARWRSLLWYRQHGGCELGPLTRLILIVSGYCMQKLSEHHSTIRILGAYLLCIAWIYADAPMTIIDLARQRERW